MLEFVHSFYRTEPAIAWIITLCAAVTIASGVYFLLSSRSARI